MKTEGKKLLASALLVGAMGVTAKVHAAPILVDNFSQFQMVTDNGGNATPTSSTVALTLGTGLTGATRTFTALATGNFIQNETIVSYNDPATNKNFLEIDNSATSKGMASISYNFNATDFTLGGSAILLDIFAINLGTVSINMIVNGVSVSGPQSFTQTGQFYSNYADFTDPSQFSNVTSLKLDFISTAQAWDGQFQVLTGGTPNVPEPTTLSLMGLALALVIGGFRMKKPQDMELATV